MSEENVEIVRDLYEGMNRTHPSDFSALPDDTRRRLFERRFHPDLDLRQNASLVIDTAETFHGYEGYVKAARELGEAFDEIRFEPGEAYESGDTVVFEVVAHATGKGSGAPVETRPFAHLWELKDGLVRRWVVYRTLEEALEAAGLDE